jgi:hypothetical protein
MQGWRRLFEGRYVGLDSLSSQMSTHYLGSMDYITFEDCKGDEPPVKIKYRGKHSFLLANMSSATSNANKSYSKIKSSISGWLLIISPSIMP